MRGHSHAAAPPATRVGGHKARRDDEQGTSLVARLLLARAAGHVRACAAARAWARTQPVAHTRADQCGGGSSGIAVCRAGRPMRRMWSPSSWVRPCCVLHPPCITPVFARACVCACALVPCFHPPLPRCGWHRMQYATYVTVPVQPCSAASTERARCMDRTLSGLTGSSCTHIHGEAAWPRRTVCMRFRFGGGRCAAGTADAQVRIARPSDVLVFTHRRRAAGRNAVAAAVCRV
jgi:hypothetical protein